tara:strand:- start:210 stop:362 length:153 start_codon:yes stop_codon:yes gene_type:complete
MPINYMEDGIISKLGRCLSYSLHQNNSRDISGLKKFDPVFFDLGAELFDG